MALYALLIVSSALLLALAFMLLVMPHDGAILSADIMDNIVITIMFACMFGNERISKKIDMLDNPSGQVKKFRHTQFRFSQLALGFAIASWVLTVFFPVTWVTVTVTGTSAVMEGCALVMLAKWKRESCKQMSSPKMKKYEGVEMGTTNQACKRRFLQTMQVEDFREG